MKKILCTFLGLLLAVGMSWAAAEPTAQATDDKDVQKTDSPSEENQDQDAENEEKIVIPDTPPAIPTIPANPSTVIPNVPPPIQNVSKIPAMPQTVSSIPTIPRNPLEEHKKELQRVKKLETAKAAAKTKLTENQ